MEYPEYDSELTKIYNLPGVRITEGYKCKQEWPHVLHVEGYLKQDYEEQAIICPECGSKAVAVSNTDSRSFNDFIINRETGRPFRFGYAKLKIKFKRYLCKECGRRFSTPSLDKIGSPNSRNTFRMENVIYDCGLWNSYTQVPNILDADISPTNVVSFMNRKINECDAKNALVLPDSIGIHKALINNKDCYIIISTKEGLLLDILSDTNIKTLMNWFFKDNRDISNVTEVVVDYVTYYDGSVSLRDILTEVFPKARFMVPLNSFVDGLIREADPEMDNFQKNKIYLDLIIKLYYDDHFSKYDINVGQHGDENTKNEELNPFFFHVLLYEYTSLATSNLFTAIDTYPTLAIKYEKEKDALLCFIQRTPEIYMSNGMLEMYGNYFVTEEYIEAEEHVKEEKITWYSWYRDLILSRCNNGDANFSTVRARLLYGKSAIGESAWKERNIYLKDGSEQKVIASSLKDSMAYSTNSWAKRIEMIADDQYMELPIVGEYNFSYFQYYPLNVRSATNELFEFIENKFFSSGQYWRRGTVEDLENYKKKLQKIRFALASADDFTYWQKEEYLEACDLSDFDEEKRSNGCLEYGYDPDYIDPMVEEINQYLARDLTEDLSLMEYKNSLLISYPEGERVSIRREEWWLLERLSENS